MHAEPPSHRLDLDSAALAHFMPMHLLLDNEGRAISFGPTLARVLNGQAHRRVPSSKIFSRSARPVGQ